VLLRRALARSAACLALAVVAGSGAPAQQPAVTGTEEMDVANGLPVGPSRPAAAPSCRAPSSGGAREGFDCGCIEEDQWCGTADCGFGGCFVRGCGGCCGWRHIPLNEDGCGVCCDDATSHTCVYGQTCCGDICCPEDTPVCCQPPDGSPRFCCLEDQKCDLQQRRCIPR